MILDVTASLNEINLSPDNEAEEILQNIRTILITLKGTVPMDREFGVNGSMIDAPLSAAQAKLTAEIVAAVNRYEPRAKVVSVAYSGQEAEGKLETKVRVKINGA